MARGAEHGLVGDAPPEPESTATPSWWDGGRLLGWLIGPAVAIRIVAAAALLVGPWTDEAAELGDWDIERFVAIAHEPGRAWRDVPVEYPPGSVVVFETLVVGQESGQGDETIVDAHRRLVALALAADLGLAWMLTRRSRRVGAGYLVLGLPLIPMGLLRLDLVVTLVAVAAALVAFRPAPSSERHRESNSVLRVGVAGLLAAIAVLIKVWPALLVPAFWGLRRDRTALATIVAMALATAGWLLWADAGLDPVRQIVDLRGATGWHVESTGGVITALAETAGLVTLDPLDQGSPVTFQLNAFRIGTLSPTLVTGGRVVAIVATVALAWRARRQPKPGQDPPPHPLARFGVVMLGSVAALLATAPLLSPQFMLWLTPWAALLLLDRAKSVPAPVVVTGAAALITGATLALFGPPRLAEPLPAMALALRNALLLYLPISCWRWLGSTAR